MGNGRNVDLIFGSFFCCVLIACQWIKQYCRYLQERKVMLIGPVFLRWFWIARIFDGKIFEMPSFGNLRLLTYWCDSFLMYWFGNRNIGMGVVNCRIPLRFWFEFDWNRNCIFLKKIYQPIKSPLILNSHRPVPHLNDLPNLVIITKTLQLSQKEIEHLLRTPEIINWFLLLWKINFWFLFYKRHLFQTGEMPLVVSQKKLKQNIINYPFSRWNENLVSKKLW